MESTSKDVNLVATPAKMLFCNRFVFQINLNTAYLTYLIGTISEVQKLKHNTSPTSITYGIKHAYRPTIYHIDLQFVV